MKIISLAFLYLITHLAATGQDDFNPFTQGVDEPQNTLRVISEVTSIEPGKPFTLALEISHLPGWHSYYKNPGSIGLAGQIDWELPEGFTADPILWPVPHISKTTLGDETTLSYGYSDEKAYLLIKITPPDSLPDEEVKIKGTATAGVCKINCEFPTQDFSISLKTTGHEINPAHLDHFKNARTHLPNTTPQDWKISQEEKDGQIIFTVDTAGQPAPQEAYLYEASNQIDSQKPQPFKTTDTGFTLTLTPNPENEKTQPLTGILSLKGHTLSPGIQIGENKDILTPPAASQTQQTSESSSYATPERIARGAELYDPESKISVVNQDGIVEKDLTFLPALLLGFIGGIILNIMPCVFPVLGIKIMGFVQQAGDDKSQIKKHGIAFTIGVLISIWILASIIIGSGSIWGEQVNNPIFLGFIVTLMFLLGLNLMGVFEIGTSLTSVGGDLQHKEGYKGSFFSGVLTTLIATPCSGPFLGAVMSFTLKQPPFSAFLLFTSFGLGVAFPYLLLSFFPKLLDYLPRPGAWMVTFKKIMAFPMFAAALFFFNGFTEITGTSGSIWLLVSILIISLAAWAYGHWGIPTMIKKKKYLWGYGFAGLCALGSISLLNKAAQYSAPVNNHGHTDEWGNVWHPWFPGVLEVAREENRVTWIDYTGST